MPISNSTSDHFCSFSFQDADIEVIHSQEPGLWSKTTRNTSAHGVEYRLQLGVTAAASALLRITGANRGVSHFVFDGFPAVEIGGLLEHLCFCFVVFLVFECWKFGMIFG